MTRRDYVLLSGAIRKASDRVSVSEGGVHYQIGITMTANEIAHALADKNPGGFDIPRFLRDAGVEPIAPVNEEVA